MRVAVSTSGKAKTKKRLEGSTLLESFFAVAISGIFFTSLFAGLSSGMFAVNYSREELRATQIIADKFETLRLYSWDQINTPGFIPATFTAPFTPEVESEYEQEGGGETSGTEGTTSLFYGSFTVENGPASVTYTNDIKLVTIELRWETGSRWRTNSISTLISRHGIQNYVY